MCLNLGLEVSLVPGLINQGVQDFTEPPAEHPKLKEINDRLAERQQSQQSREQSVKTELVGKASAHLEKFYTVSLLGYFILELLSTDLHSEKRPWLREGVGRNNRHGRLLAGLIA